MGHKDTRLESSAGDGAWNPCLRTKCAFNLLAGSENEVIDLFVSIATGAEWFSGKEVL